MKQQVVDSSQNCEISAIGIAKLTLLGSVLTSIGDAIATVVAALELEKTMKTNTQQESLADQQQILDSLQKQINELRVELENLKQI